MDLGQEIRIKMEKGLINQDLEPIKCECGSTKFKDKITDMISTVVSEKERYCEGCGELVGYWSYGVWMP